MTGAAGVSPGGSGCGRVAEDDVATGLAPTAYEKVAEGFGAHGIGIAEPDHILPALEEARRIAAGGRPVLINVHIGRTGFRDGSISM